MSRRHEQCRCGPPGVQDRDLALYIGNRSGSSVCQWLMKTEAWTCTGMVATEKPRLPLLGRVRISHPTASFPARPSPAIPEKLHCII